MMTHSAPIMKDDISYECLGIRYFLYFPIEWSGTHHPGTGPLQCKKCAVHGIIDNLFLGYCVDCATYMYDYNRGHGFLFGKERVDVDQKLTSASFTYLKYTKYDDYFTFEQVKKIKSLSFSKEEEILIKQRTLSNDSAISISDLILRKLSISSDSAQ